MPSGPAPRSGTGAAPPGVRQPPAAPHRTVSGGDSSHWVGGGDISGHRSQPPWTCSEGWQLSRLGIDIEGQQHEIVRPDHWPYPDLFILERAQLPWWVHIPDPPAPLAHLPVRGFCTRPCSAATSGAPWRSRNCYVLCFRPVHLGEHSGHSNHCCWNCLIRRPRDP